MALQPVQFTRPRKEPSLLERVFLGTVLPTAATLGTNVLLDKFVQRPAEQRAEARQVAAEGRAEGAATRAREHAAGIDVEMTNLRSSMARADQEHNLFTVQPAARELAREEERQLLRGGAFEFIIPGFEQLANLDPEGTPNPSSFQELEALSNLAGLRQRERGLDLQERGQATQERDQFAQLLAQFGERDVSPFLVRERGPDGELTGEITLPSPRQMSLMSFRRAIDAGELLGQEDDPRVRRALQESRTLEEDVVPVPAYDPALELQALGKIAQPDAQGAAFLDAIISGLGRAGFAGGEAGRGFWFLSDQGELVEAKSKQELLTKLPQQARDRVRGVLWHDLFNLRDAERFNAAQTQYGLTAPAAVETWRRLTGQQGAQTSTGAGTGTSSEDSTSAARQQPLSTESFALPEARTFAEGATRQQLEEVDAAASHILEDPEYFDTAVAAIDSVFALPDNELRQTLIQRGLLNPGGRRTGTIRGEPQRERADPLPERDRLRFDMMQLLELAQREAEARRRRSQQ